MKKITFIFLFLLSASVCFADKLTVPFSCWPQELKKEFAKIGRKLDLSSDVRTDDSWGYVANRGNEYDIVTYRSATQEDLEVIQNIVFKIELQKREQK